MSRTANLPVRLGGREVAVTVVDAAVADALGRWKWCLNGRGYAMGSPGLLHRVVLGLEKGDGSEVDHLNRDKLDNRRTNLRLVEHSENVRNTDYYDEITAARARCVELWETGLTRAEVARETGRGYQFVVKALKGKHRPRTDIYWTQDRIADFLRTFHAAHGRLPRNHEMNGQNGSPWFPTIYRRFGSVMEARAYAGFGEVDLRRPAA